MDRRRLAPAALLLGFCACGGANGGGGGSSWSGTWEQVACADDTGAEVSCPVPMTDDLKRMIAFSSDGSTAEVWVKGTPEDAAIGEVRDDQICLDVLGNELCYPLSLVDGLLLYCLTGDLCEQLEQIE